jgi:hypothetical protein
MYITGLKFSPVNGSRAVASIYNNSVQLFTLTPQTIYSEYSLSVNISNYNIDILPSGNQAVVAAFTQLNLF